MIACGNVKRNTLSSETNTTNANELITNHQSPADKLGVSLIRSLMYSSCQCVSLANGFRFPVSHVTLGLGRTCHVFSAATAGS